MLIDEYKNCVAVTVQADYADRRSIRRSNRAVARMYALLREAAATDPSSIEALYQLLDDPQASKWLAHQLVEVVDLPAEIEEKCFSIVKRLSQGDGPEAFGERLWLDEWMRRKEVHDST
jgi:hypothetical protein